MQWVDDTVAAFGRSLGLDDLSLGPLRHVELALPDGATAGIAHLAELPGAEVLVYRCRPLFGDVHRYLRAALRLVDHRQPWTWPVQTALRDGMLMFAARIPPRAFTADAVGHAYAELDELHRRAAQPGAGAPR